MVIRNSYPDKAFPCLVQIKFYDGDIAFYKCRNFKSAFNYNGKPIALFKCKIKQK
jgi:hypothetical protein